MCVCARATVSLGCFDWELICSPILLYVCFAVTWLRLQKLLVKTLVRLRWHTRRSAYSHGVVCVCRRAVDALGPHCGLQDDVQEYAGLYVVVAVT